MTQQLDPYAAAMTVQVNGPKTYFGEITTVDLAFYVLKKGEQKRLYDPQTDPQSSARLLIDLHIQPLQGEYEIKQDVFNFSTEWNKHTLPSLQKLAADVRTLQGKYCSIQKIATGETYTSKDKLDPAGNIIEAGTIKNKMAIVFIAIYDSRETCEAAADAFYGNTPAVPAVAADVDLNNPERVQAAGILSTLWTASGQSPAKFLDMIASAPTLNIHFNETSPEVTHFTGGVPF